MENVSKRVLSDQLKICVTADPSEGFLDRMISLVEGARRQKTPNEIALLVCLMPTTIGGLLSAIGIAGMNRLLQRAVEAAGGMITGDNSLTAAAIAAEAGVDAFFAQATPEVNNLGVVYLGQFK